MLGALVAAIVGIGIAISVRIYTQLDSAQSLQRALVASQLAVDKIVSTQLDQETALRGYLASGETLFLQPYPERTENYDGAIARFRATSAELDMPELVGPTNEMVSLHQSWERVVALPLLKHPHAKDALSRETYGKVLIDSLLRDTESVQALLAERVDYTQSELKRRINEALFGGLASVLVFGLVGILFVGSRQQMLAVIDRERSIVETLQGAFLTDLDGIPGSRVGRAYLSADEDAAVGGDLFDIRRLDASRTLVVVADVSGKGIAAAVNTAFVKYSLRTLARSCGDAGEILMQFNDVFLETVRDPNLFVVTFVGILHAQARRLEYASAGHGAAFVRHAGGVRQLMPTGPVVGILPSAHYATENVPLEDGDMLLVATDGLTEARDLEGNLLDDSGAMALFAETSRDPQTAADGLVESIRQRGGGRLSDDLALLVIALDPRTA